MRDISQLYELGKNLVQVKSSTVFEGVASYVNAVQSSTFLDIVSLFTRMMSIFDKFLEKFQKVRTCKLIKGNV